MTQQYSPPPGYSPTGAPAGFTPPRSSPFAPLPSLSPAQAARLSPRSTPVFEQQQFTPAPQQQQQRFIPPSSSLQQRFTPQFSPQQFGTPPSQQQFPQSQQFAPGDVKGLSLSSSPPRETRRMSTSSLSLSPSRETKRGLATSLSSEDITDLRPHLHLQIDVGAEDMNMTQEQLDSLFHAIREFFNPDNVEPLKLVPITVGTEGYKIPGNPAVIAAHSSVMLPFATDYATKGTPIPPLVKELRVSLSPKAFVSAWIYVNGLSSDLWNWENNITDNAMLYLWLRALGVNTEDIEFFSEWMVGFAILFGTSEDIVLNAKPFDMSPENWQRLQYPYGGEDGMPSVVRIRKITKPTQLSEVERKLLTAIYDDLAPMCNRLIESKGRVGDFSACQIFDDLADVLSRPRVEFHAYQDLLGEERYPETKERVTMPAAKLSSKEPNLSPYVVFGTQASVNAAIVLSTDPSYAKVFYPPLIVGEERVTVYGNPVVMSAHSSLFARLLERGVDTKAYPVLAANLKVANSPRAFLAVWLYMNGVDTSFGRNLSVLEMMQMWEWMNYFDISNASTVGYWLKTIVHVLATRVGYEPVGYMSQRLGAHDIRLLDNVKLSDEEKRTLASIHAKILPRCKRTLETFRERTFDPVCNSELIQMLEMILGIAPESRVKPLTWQDESKIQDNLIKDYAVAFHTKLGSMTPEELKRVAFNLNFGADVKETPLDFIINIFPRRPARVLDTLGIPYTIRMPEPEAEPSAIILPPFGF